MKQVNSRPGRRLPKLGPLPRLAGHCHEYEPMSAAPMSPTPMTAAQPHVLDNPIWSSLRSRHAALALSAGPLARYPAQVAPFMGVAEEGADATAALDELVPAQDT